MWHLLFNNENLMLQVKTLLLFVFIKAVDLWAGANELVYQFEPLIKFLGSTLYLWSLGIVIYKHYQNKKAKEE